MAAVAHRAALEDVLSARLGVQWSIPPPGREALYRPPIRQAFRDIYEELVEIDTSPTTGSCTRAAEAMLAHLRAAGYSERDARVIVPDGAPELGRPAGKPVAQWHAHGESGRTATTRRHRGPGHHSRRTLWDVMQIRDLPHSDPGTPDVRSGPRFLLWLGRMQLGGQARSLGWGTE